MSISSAMCCLGSLGGDVQRSGTRAKPCGIYNARVQDCVSAMARGSRMSAAISPAIISATDVLDRKHWRDGNACAAGDLETAWK